MNKNLYLQWYGYYKVLDMNVFTDIFYHNMVWTCQSYHRTQEDKNSSRKNKYLINIKYLKSLKTSLFSVCGTTKCFQGCAPIWGVFVTSTQGTVVYNLKDLLALESCIVCSIGILSPCIDNILFLNEYPHINRITSEPDLEVCRP